MRAHRSDSPPVRCFNTQRHQFVLYTGSRSVWAEPLKRRRQVRWQLDIEAKAHVPAQLLRSIAARYSSRARPALLLALEEAGTGRALGSSAGFLGVGDGLHADKSNFDTEEADGIEEVRNNVAFDRCA